MLRKSIVFVTIIVHKAIYKPKVNNQIRARELQVIDHDGSNLGVITLEEALRRAFDVGLDVVEIAPTANPPVAKITDRGKYIYEQEKKARQAAKRRKEVEIKSVRIGIGTSQHDLALKARQADEFLKEGNKIKVDLALRGREKYLDRKFLEARIERLLVLIAQPFTAEPITKAPRGLSAILGPGKTNSKS